MRSSKLAAMTAGIVFWALSLAGSANAQRVYEGRGTGVIDPGTNVVVRTIDPIHANDSDGRVFSGVVEQDVRDRRGDIVVPRGSNVEMMVRRINNNELALDLDSLTINGERYGVQSDENVVGSNEGIGANRRTGEYLGGGAVLGAIIGAIAGGGKGAAIGAGAGAAAGAGAQVLTRGRDVDVPAESLLTFRLAAPLRAGVADYGYMQNGYHYHRGYGSQQYPEQQAYRQKPGAYNNGQARLTIGSNNVVTWDAAQPGNIYVQEDNEQPKLFASGQSGSQPAPWISAGHVYTFTLQDQNGNVMAQDQVDLRSNNRGYNRNSNNGNYNNGNYNNRDNRR